MTAYTEVRCTYKTLNETTVASRQISYSNLQEMYSLMGNFIDKCKNNGRIVTISLSNVYEVSEYDTDWLDEEIEKLKEGREA